MKLSLTAEKAKSKEILAIAQEKAEKLAEEKRIADEEAAKERSQNRSAAACGNCGFAKSSAK